jgi:hypothetical protein
MANDSNLVPFRFKPGQSGNPWGRAEGCRNKISTGYLHAFAEHFEKHGAEAIDRVCKLRKCQETLKIFFIYGRKF